MFIEVYRVDISIRSGQGFGCFLVKISTHISTLALAVRHNGVILKVAGDDILIDNFDMPTLWAGGDGLDRLLQTCRPCGPVEQRDDSFATNMPTLRAGGDLPQILQVVRPVGSKCCLKSLRLQVTTYGSIISTYRPYGPGAMDWIDCYKPADPAGRGTTR